MKTTLLKTTTITMCMYVAMAFTTSKTFAQGTLQFNQVISRFHNTLTSAYVVPAGKVFKLESLTLDPTTAGQAYLFINGIRTIWIDYSTNPPKLPTLPMWFKAGDIIDNNNTGSQLYMTGIEFNVVP
jgi:hypothetical protein